MIVAARPEKLPDQIPPKMRVGLYYGHADLRVEERPVPQIGAGELLAQVMACGICGSDTMKWYREPATQGGHGINTGHEIAGRIVRAGADVRGWKAGDRVIITHHFPCLQCTPCLDGNETACEAMHDKHIEPGGFSEYIRLLDTCISRGLYALPDAMSYEEGSFVEPLACVVRSVRKTAPVADRTVLVLGSGLAGLLHIKLARALGAKSICAADMNDDRLRAAKDSGADEVRRANEPLPHADRVFVCTGSAAASQQALDLVSRGGHLMFFAADGPDKSLSIPITLFWFTQPAIQFSYGAAPRDMHEAIELIASRRVCVEDLVTHRFAITQMAEAFDLASNPRGNSLKVIIQPNGAAA